MARVKYLQPDEIEKKDKALFDRLQRERKVPTGNIFLALANVPQMLDGFLTYANSLRAGDLSPKLREMAVLTVGHCTASEYEIAHHHSHGLKAGITAEQLEAIPNFETSSLFNDEERAVMSLAKESTLRVDVTDQTWNQATKFLSETQMVELVLTIAWYNSGVRIMGALGIDLEDSYRNPH
ncbi:carboxymuconolactone decarboxylase family protein [Microvirga zambiensis]|uniref:carboxymuconolactone decarboxylase family protein n=1 Tax=Microvirga zambiensis TaxID=1402137 RepID=UPI0019200429|nr:carboxymuconolactone decarboxylase family protein [Microvirga zambiensis]